MICPPLAVCTADRLKAPQAPVLPHVMVQFTPTLPVLGVAVATSVVCEPVFSVAGSGNVVEIATTIGAFVTTFTVADADLLGSVVDFAVTVMVPPAVTVEVLLKIVATALAVWPEILPQFDVLQLNVQSTPPADASLETKAVRLVERPGPVL